MAEHEHMMSKKPNPTQISTKAPMSIRSYLSTDAFKDMPLWKIIKLFANEVDDIGF